MHRTRGSATFVRLLSGFAFVACGSARAFCIARADKMSVALGRGTLIGQIGTFNALGYIVDDR